MVKPVFKPRQSWKRQWFLKQYTQSVNHLKIEYIKIKDFCSLKDINKKEENYSSHRLEEDVLMHVFDNGCISRYR